MAWIYVENEMSKMKLPETVIAVSILAGIVKQCQICRKCRKFVVKKWWEMESANKMNAGSEATAFMSK